MGTLTFFARADSITANNATLNPIGITGAQGFPTTAITFTDNNGAGDLLLDKNGGLADPDTQVVINGVTYNFTLELIGTLPSGNSQLNGAAAPLAGKQIALITVVINGTARQLFFVTDGTATFGQMNAIGNGAIPLVPSSVDPNPDPFYPCFCTGTLIATPSGPRAIETLVAGDMVLNEHGEEHQIHWAGRSRVSLDTLRSNENLAPIRIAAGAFGPAMPNADLYVSPQHRIVLDGAAAELLFGEARVLAAAKHLVGTFAERVQPEADVEYFHILTEAHEILVSNGLRTESFQPARRTIDVMLPKTQAVLEEALSILGRDDMLTRKDALPSLNRAEARTIAAMMKGWQAQPQRPAQAAAAC